MASQNSILSLYKGSTKSAGALKRALSRLTSGKSEAQSLARAIPAAPPDTDMSKRYAAAALARKRRDALLAQRKRNSGLSGTTKATGAPGYRKSGGRVT